MNLLIMKLFHSERERQTDRQTERQTNRQTDKGRKRAQSSMKMKSFLSFQRCYI